MAYLSPIQLCLSQPYAAQCTVAWRSAAHYGPTAAWHTVVKRGVVYRGLAEHGVLWPDEVWQTEVKRRVVRRGVAQRGVLQLEVVWSVKGFVWPKFDMRAFLD